MKTLTIKQVMDLLEYKDARSVKNWCDENNISIIVMGKTEIVIESEFFEIVYRPFVNKLKRKFGNDWESVYKLYSEGNIPALNEINDLSKNSYPIYQRETKSESKFFKKLIEYENKKKNAA